jgi:predicted ATP-binding protein involved in virulence
MLNSTDFGARKLGRAFAPTGAHLMQLASLQLLNYRCFNEIDISFHPNMTVIVAENGQGKSSVLDAIRAGLWPFISSFDLARSSTFNDPLNSIAIADVRLLKTQAGDMARQLPTQVRLTGDWGQGQIQQWMRYRESEAEKSKTKEDARTVELKHYARNLQEQIRDAQSSVQVLPVFGYYGTGRLWAQKKLTEVKKDEKDDSEADDFYIRSFAYRNCMDPASSFKHFRIWFIWAWESYSNMLMRDNVSVGEKQMALSRIQVVQKVIDTFLKETTGWHTLEYSIEDQKTLILKHDQLGRMRVDFLSDGIRSMLAMVGDIAYRCVKLNPHLGESAAQKTAGVILIDEVDMHLHPRWQQLVLTQLQKAFPQIQFIVTTHSPQVLTSVDAGCIRILSEGQMHNAPAGTEGAESSRLLKRIFGVEVRPPENPATIELNSYLEFVFADHWDEEEALRLRAILDKRYQGEEPALTGADLYINNRKWELSLDDENSA